MLFRSVGVSLSIDNKEYLNEIVNDLQKFGDVSVDEKMVIICVVGNLPQENISANFQIIKALENIPVRMISYGGSNYNISFIIPEEYKEQALKSLSKNLFE